MRVVILTSSRADYGIYLPLIKKIKNNVLFETKLLAFGTHLSEFHGATYKQIESDGFSIDYKLDTVPDSDTPLSISIAIGDSIKKFAQFWENHGNEFDLAICLGDRYEMFAAVVAGIPFQISFAHFHGGETTLGAIDNVFRHSITLASKYHFTATKASADRVKELIQSDLNVYNVGSLSLDNISTIKLLTLEDFKEKWGIDMSKRTILITFHPETVRNKENFKFGTELIKVIKDMREYQIIITMPNADTSGNLIRQLFIQEFTTSERVFLVENLGTQSYFTAMKYCSFMLGNTSSGIIEASSFGKYVINIGDRQKGRDSGPNVIHTSIIAEKIEEAIRKIEKSPKLKNENIYYNGGAADKVIEVLLFHKTNI
jgi:GDP/UDP-N,N'-diacetylbacillosamine 2-epimerase (hydrolysing)